MIIWSGLGFLVAVFVFGSSLIFNLGFNQWMGEGYYDTHKWPFALSLVLSAVICWFLGSALRKRNAQVVVDKETGQEIVLNHGNHRLFFIPMHIWGPILVAIAAVVLVMDLMK
jgi:hypothetical protein